MQKIGRSNRRWTPVCPPYIYVNLRKILKSAKYKTKIAKSSDKIAMWIKLKKGGGIKKI